MSEPRRLYVLLGCRRSEDGSEHVIVGGVFDDPEKVPHFVADQNLLGTSVVTVFENCWHQIPALQVKGPDR
jgi:hypothetical protein